ncbi:flavin-containing monooxygenase [uncultured Jatrophihabitans sp.]|uniref:flavin-containing monooxygenase n=1 Tax=uncultured Jatrophihabitans sp. TaxID=1610747 RepID=UPI0035CC8A7E
MSGPHTDVLIIGAGISGIGTACHLARDCPDKEVRILERRATIGGTWDLFRYPGVRSDSDMFTFGYNFRPWSDTKVLADGAAIREYLHDTAVEYDIERLIEYDRQVVKASWSSAQNCWTVETRNGAGEATETFTADVVVAGTGYYNYDTGYRPEFPGQQDFTGTVVHPQHWPADLDYAGKKVVIIGSGATAVTLVPAMAAEAAHVTMLQRSPTYIVSLPARDGISAGLRRFLPDSVVWKLARSRNIGVQRATYALARVRPDTIRRFVVKGAEKALAGSSDIANFTPKYDPWDQRLCVVPDGDLFRTIRSGKADVVTDRIKTFTADGIELESGDRLEADIIVSATGLDVQILGGATLEVDAEPVAVNERLTYKATLIEGVPNFAFVFGYINASWTLKADLAGEYVCRLLNHLDRHGLTTFVAHGSAGDHGQGSVLGALNSGYVRRGDPHLPRQGARGPWRVTNDFLRDAATLRHGSIDDGVLEFTTHENVEPQRRPRPAAAAS